VANSVCSCEARFRSVCEGLPVDFDYQGKPYCVLHLPRGSKGLARFAEVIEQKLKNKDFDFRGVYFPSIPSNIEGPRGFFDVTFEGEADFSDATFQEKGASFQYATFKESATFHNATFEGMAFFARSIFEGEANFNEATFKGMANFYNATFEDRARFYNATFEEEAYFAYATFQEIAFFYNATFQEGANFWSLQTSPTQTRLIFRAAVIDKPERFSFHSTYLRPSWFLDVDAQKFDFSDVEWFRLPNGKKLTLEKEIEFLDGLPRIPAYERTSPRSNLRKLQMACRRLMNNAEENRAYPTANEFHYWSMELQRKESWWRRLGLRGTSYWAYWALSGYGERPRRAFLVLVGMWALFALLYMMAGPSQLKVFSISLQEILTVSAQDIRTFLSALRVPSPFEIKHFWADIRPALVYSLGAIARLRPYPLPGGPSGFQFLVTAEGILGPLQIALLALAIRRQVMR
jgi:hypothetical protein